jgi:hypothetical protein
MLAGPDIDVTPALQTAADGRCWAFRALARVLLGSVA